MDYVAAPAPVPRPDLLVFRGPNIHRPIVDLPIFAVNSRVTASIVSHGHGSMVCRLIEDLLVCPEVGKIIVTQNMPEQISYPENPRLERRLNPKPRGYGANHNTTFAVCETPFFCVLNPDIRLHGNPFPALLQSFQSSLCAAAAPLVLNPDRQIEDSARQFPTLISLLGKAFGICNGRYNASAEKLSPDWLAGMFVLLRSEAFKQVGGFDEGYYLYYEDVDLCWRMRRAGWNIMQDTSVAVIHDARRASRRDLIFARWHAVSMLRYLFKTCFR